MRLSRRSFFVGGAAAAGAVAIAGSRLSMARDWLDVAQRRSSAPASGLTLSVSDLGAIGDGRQDDRAAIQRTIDTVSSAGGGTILLPAGTYVVGRSDSRAFAIELKSNVTLQGEGAASIVKLANDATGHGGGHTIYVDNARNVGIVNLVVDGNRLNQRRSGHCFKSDGVDGLILQNLVVKNAASYGLGFQDGVNKRIRMDGVLIEDTGADGIDFKNKRNGNAHIELKNVTVRRWGLRNELDIQAAIDCRGVVEMTNIRVTEPGADDAVGIRMRHGELRDRNGVGGHGSTLNGFEVRMDGGRARIGIDAVARNVTIRDGSVSGCLRGLFVRDSGFRGVAIGVTGCSETGILIDAADSELDGDASVLYDCRVDRCAGNGIEVQANNAQIVRCVSTGNGRYGLLIRDTASATRVVGGDFSDNGAGPIANRGSNSRIAMLAS